MAFRVILTVVIVTALVLLGVVGPAYILDAPIPASVDGKSCQVGGGSTVDVVTDVFQVERTVVLPYEECLDVKASSDADYHFRTGRVSLYDDGGACTWDTTHPPDGCDD